MCGLGSRDTLRLEAGLCLYGSDIDDTTSPIEAGLAWTVAKARRDPKHPIRFPGWDRIMKELQGDAVARKRVGFLVDVRGGVGVSCLCSLLTREVQGQAPAAAPRRDLQRAGCTCGIRHQRHRVSRPWCRHRHGLRGQGEGAASSAASRSFNHWRCSPRTSKARLCTWRFGARVST